MFFANIKIAEKYDYLEDKFKKAYQWLKDTNIMALAEGVYPIDGETVYAQVQEYETIDPADGFFENHEKHFDIQYMAKGEENFGICKTEGLVLRERLDEKDLLFYEEPKNSGYVYLKEGDFIVVAPEDAHKPRLMVGERASVKKVVVKVLV